MSKKKVIERFADETSIHGIKDYYYGSGRDRVFWGILAVFAIAGLFLQLEGVVTQYAEQETGTTMRPFSHTRMPAVSICPDDWADATKLEKHGLSRKSVSIINGFMPLLGLSLVYRLPGKDLTERAAEASRKYGGLEYQKIINLWNQNGQNIENVTQAIARDTLAADLRVIYPMEEVMTIEREVTLSGVCYKFEGHRKVNPMQSTYAGIKMAFKVAGVAPDLVTEPKFRIVMSPADEVNLFGVSSKSFLYHYQYTILYSVKRFTRVSTRNRPCIHRTPGDTGHCEMSYGNQVYPGEGGFNTTAPTACQIPLPHSTKYPALKIENPCNTLIDILGSSMMRRMNASNSDARLLEVCPQHCESTSYQYTYQMNHQLFTETTNSSYTMLEVSAEEGISGLEVKEYIILGLAGMLSNVGGTLGLWIGASVISLVQVVYILLLQDSKLCKPSTKTTTVEMAAPRVQ